MFYLLRNQLVFLLGLASLLVSSFAFSNPISVPKTIAITQIVGHEALDKVRKGIIDELAKNGYQDGEQAHVIFENAQGNVVIATQIAQQFVALHPDIIVAIATPSAQAVANSAKKTSIPIVFASISDPVQAKLVTNLKHPGMNITGTRNVSPIDKQIALVKEILPNVKTLGVVLNYGEVNSVDLLQAVTSEAKNQNIQVKTAAVTTSADVQTAVTSLVGKVDALILLQDNTVASALPALIKVTHEHHIPVFTTYLDAIKAGALAGIAFDEYAIGQQTGKIVVAVLNGKKAGDVSVEDPTNIKLTVNDDAVKNLNIKLSDDLIKRAKHVCSEKVK